MTDSTTATVETLTAEVRTLVVGSRQVTLSVYAQLDWADAGDIEPFGRVEPKSAQSGYLYAVGRRAGGRDLVRATIPASAEAIRTELSALRNAAREADPVTTAALDRVHTARKDSKRLLSGPYQSARDSEKWVARREAEAEAAATDAERESALSAAEHHGRQAAKFRADAEKERLRAERLEARALQWNAQTAELLAALSARQGEHEALARRWSELPKIVLAGLR